MATNQEIRNAFGLARDYANKKGKVMVEWKQSDNIPDSWYLLDTDASVEFRNFERYEACNGFGSYLDFPTLAQAMAWCETQQNNPDEYVSPGMLKAALATQYPDENRISFHSMQRAIAAALKQYKVENNE